MRVLIVTLGLTLIECTVKNHLCTGACRLGEMVSYCRGSVKWISAGVEEQANNLAPRISMSYPLQAADTVRRRYNEQEARHLYRAIHL